jgi:predicted methyltransferase
MTRPLLVLLLASAAACAPKPELETTPRPGAGMTRPPAAIEDAALTRVLADPARSADARSRDQYRHPREALTFWGLRPGMTILEVGPGSGWWTEILAPYAAATEGRYLATAADPSDPQIGAARAVKSRADFVARYTAPRFGRVELADFGPTVGLKAPPDTVDFALVARAFHNYARQGDFTDKLMANLFTALRPGGVLAVEQHRAPEGADPKAGTGYVPESYVIEAAQRAGFRLDGRSEINANPRDDRDHPFGVWTLQPVRRAEQDGRKLTEAERATFDAIGESDRMTLRFVKPA